MSMSSDPTDVIAQALRYKVVPGDEYDIAAAVVEALLAAGTVEWGVRMPDGTVTNYWPDEESADWWFAQAGPGLSVKVQRRVAPSIKGEWTT